MLACWIFQLRISLRGGIDPTHPILKPSVTLMKLFLGILMHFKVRLNADGLTL